jgi:hypothetical protein
MTAFIARGKYHAPAASRKQPAPRAARWLEKKRSGVSANCRAGVETR